MESGKRKRDNEEKVDQDDECKTKAKIIKMDPQSKANEYWQQFQSIPDTQPENKIQRLECLKKATELGHPRAQYEWALAVLLGNGCEKNIEKAYELCLESARSGYAEAQFQIAAAMDTYYKAKFIAPVKNDQEAMQWYLKAAEQGYRTAQNCVGCAYEYGQGCSVDLNKAVYWFFKAAQQEATLACESLSDFIQGRQGYVMDVSMATNIATWAQSLAEKSNPIGFYFLGMCYKTGKGREQNHEQAEICFLKSAEKNYGPSHFEMSRIYERRKDDSGTLEWLKKAADSGIDRAQYYLGYCLFDGKYGQLIDQKMGIQWYLKAAEQDYTPAQIALGWIYYNGEFVEKDHATAIQWWMKAAVLGSVNAQMNIADAYSKGEGGLNLDYKEAFKWYSKAADKRDGEAAFLCGLYIMEEKMTDIKEQKECIPWFRRSNDYGYTVGTYALAHVLDQTALPFSEQKKEALSLYLQAAEKGHCTAQFVYGRKLLNGENSDKDEKKALEWLQKASEQGNMDASNLISKYQSTLSTQKTLSHLDMILEQIQEMKQQMQLLQKTQQEATCCSICYTERPNWCLPCHHVICVDCKDKLQSKTCPKCRASFQTNPGHLIFY